MRTAPVTVLVTCLLIGCTPQTQAPEAGCDVVRLSGLDHDVAIHHSRLAYPDRPQIGYGPDPMLEVSPPSGSSGIRDMVLYASHSEEPTSCRLVSAPDMGIQPKALCGAKVPGTGLRLGAAFPGEDISHAEARMDGLVRYVVDDVLCANPRSGG
jgi:hypothetical protein